MIKRVIPLLMLLCLMPVTSWACMMDAPAVTEQDVMRVITPSQVETIIAAQGTIKKINVSDDLSVKPHGGFTIDIEINKTYQGEPVEGIITVQYGPCHNLPGEEGELIYVIAYENEDGSLYAPQFWETEKE